MKHLHSNLLLLLCALIWGFAFSAQASGMEYIGPWTFTCVRSFIAAITLRILMPVLDSIRSDVKVPSDEKERRHLLKAGVLCGFFLCSASMFQQTGLLYASVGKAGFLTALYVILVPIIGLFFGRKTNKRIFLSAFIALCGFWLLSVNEEFTIGKGDLLLVICSFLFAGHILVIDRYADSTDGVRLSCIQFVVCGVICFIPMMILEHPSLKNLIDAAVPVLYAGVLSSGAGYTLQILGQKDADPTAAGMILSLESVFSAIGGWLILHQTLSLRELTGCAIVFAAVILCTLTEKEKAE